MLVALPHDVGKLVAESVLEFERHLFGAATSGNGKMLPESNTGRVRLGGYTVSFLVLFLLLLSAVNACICVSFMVVAVQLWTRSLVYLRFFMRCLFFHLLRLDALRQRRYSFHVVAGSHCLQPLTVSPLLCTPFN